MKRYVFPTLALLAALASPARAQVAYNGGVYSQNFDSLPGTTNNTLNAAWTDNSMLPGWYANKAALTVTDGTVGGTAATFSPTAAANTNNVGLFSFGTAASTDRALGSRATAAVAGNNPVLYGVRLVNNTSQTLTSFTVTYTGEQWFKTGKTTADTLLMDYQVGASDITSGTWLAATGATFTSLINTTTAATVAGNAAANRRGLAAKVTGVSWAPGAELWVRFRDADEAGDEQGLAVDDFSFVADNESGVFLNGSTSYGTMGFGATAASLNASNFTIECRFMRTGPGVTASTGNGGITTALPLIAKGVGEADGTNVDADYFLGIDNVTGKLVADFEQLNATNDGTARAAGLNFPIMGSTVLQNGVFYHVAATYDTVTATWKLFVNGVPEVTVVPSGSATTFVGVVPRNDNIQGVGIGTTINSTGARAGFFHGFIDEARIWNLVRTPEEILANKDVKIASGVPGLLGRYGFDEGTGTTTAGINAAGAAAPVCTLAGTQLPVWVNSKSFVPNIAPAVVLTTPVSGDSVIFPASINLAADATDSDGTISKVEFFNGGTKVGEDLTAPYTFSWAGAAVGGPYSLTAVATDNGGTSTTSAPATVQVLPNPNQPPSVTVSSPANNATDIGASSTLNLSLADNEGDAQTVSFYGRVTTPVVPGPDFTFIAIPDTQYYSENTNRNPSSTGNPTIDTGANASIYNAQTQWIVNNRAALNIPFVSHMGDIAQNGDAFESEWIVADAAMSRLENPASTLRAHGIPWGVAPGNHDQQPVADAAGVTNFYTKYFNFTRWESRPYYGGHYGMKRTLTTDPAPNYEANTNNYQLFSAGGMDFIIVHLEYDARAVSNYQPILDWADALLKAYPNRRAIITSHWIINTGNPATFSTQGQAIYDSLKNNSNLFLLLCGHVNGEGFRSDTYQGRTVYSILSDYQESKNGGNGFLRKLTFKPGQNKISVESYSPTLGRAVNASDSVPAWTATYEVNYNMQSSVTGWIPLGTTNVSAGGTTASLNWTGLEAGKNYEWYATSNDGINTTTTATNRFSTITPAAPSITLDTPSDGASYPVNSTVSLAATASDVDGTIAKVEFFDGGKKIGEDSTAPYSFDWVNPAPGTHPLTAIVTDNSGLDAISSVATVTVTNLSPTIALTAPADVGTFDALANINLTATAADADGTVAKVEFYNGTTKLGEDTTDPYAFTWSNVVTGSYAITAKAIDDRGAITTSSTANITVTNADNVAPTVAITAPGNNVAFAAGSTLNITANASDTDGALTKVEFFQGTTKLGEDTTAPYAFSWTNVAAGSYTLTAVATDNDGSVTTSAAVVAVSDASLWAYSQSFDGMGTGTAPPAGWSFYGVFGNGNSTFTDTIPITNASVVGGTLNNTLTAATTFTTSSNTAGFNFALPASTSDRALGTSPTTGQFVALQLSLTNPTGAPLSALRIGYDIRRFTSVATANELPGYWLFYSLDNGTTWTNVTLLNPTLANVPNTVGVTTIPSTSIGLSGPWNAGSTLLFRWVDDNAVATSPDQIIGLDNLSITVPVGQPPVATLTAPTDGTIGYLGDTINLTANASDSDGSISKVEFYQGTTKLGEDLAAPYVFDWSGFGVGSYSLTARAIDNDGNVSSSATAAVTIYAVASSGTLTRGPYLNQGNHNSIVVRWRSSQPVVGRVRYGTSSSNLNQVTNETSAKTDHEIKLTGLTPYTRYYYSVGSAFDTLTPETAETTSFTPGAPVPTAADYTFRTSPVPGTAVNTRIWIVGDCGRGTQVQATARDAYYSYTGSRIPDLNLEMGDNAYNSGTDSEYQSGYFNMYSNIFRKMPQWSCLGNHDANNGSTSTTANFPYFDMFTFPTAGECGGVASGTERYYSFDYGNIHFICLDSQASSTAVDNPATAGVNEDGPMATWLRADLAANTATWTIAFWHHPPYSKGSHDSDSEAQMVNMRTNFNPILEAGGVDLLYFGHSHNYERSVLLDGHYGTSGTITSGMKLNSGNGSVTGFTTGGSGVIRNSANNFTAAATVNGTVIPGNGAYIKPLTGPRDHFGAVYNTAGMSGLADSGSVNHSAMYICYNTVGTVNLDVNGNSLTSTFIQSGGTAPDNFTITKQGAADTDHDGVSDEYEIAHGMSRYSNDATADSDSDGISNLAEYAFGTDSAHADSAPLNVNVDAGVINTRGQPTTWLKPTTSGTDFRVIFTRRKDAAANGLVYTPQFSADLTTWVNSTATPAVVADGGEIEAVSIRYPFFIDGRKPRFFRLSVSAP